MKILGISAFYHDSAAAIIVDGKIQAAVQEERFTRRKHDPSFPVNAIKYCLEYTGVKLSELDAVAFYDKPLLKFERLLETYYSFAPKGWGSFIRAIPIWSKEKLFLKSIISKHLKEINSGNKVKVKYLFSEHHLSHAASAFYPSPFQRAAILTIDGVGEWATASICLGDDKKIELLKELKFPNSVGLLYSAFTYFLGFRVNSGEYKLMGLAPYGNKDSDRVQTYIKKIKEQLIDLRADGSLLLDQSYFNYATGDRMIHAAKWEDLFGFSTRLPEDEMEQQHCDLALAIQTVTEEIVIKMAREAKRLTGADNICLAGGVALNCVANGKLLEENLFKEIYIQPAAGDAGGALGAALSIHHMYFEKDRAIVRPDSMGGAYLGPEFSSLDIEKIARKYDATYVKYDHFEDLAKEVATMIEEGEVIGWFQGRMEFGPRALGNRSLLGDPRSPKMQRHMNLKIKFRESFRPFAPAVLAEDVQQFFDINTSSPYMLLVRPVQSGILEPVASDYQGLELQKKLYVVRSQVPAITHVDFSARIQTVHEETNSRFHTLLRHFKALTGIGMLINTSFNVRGEPIVCTPDDAFQCFVRTGMDVLVLGNYLFKRADQENMEPLKAVLEKEFVLD